MGVLVLLVVVVVIVVTWESKANSSSTGTGLQTGTELGKKRHLFNLMCHFVAKFSKFII